MMNRSKDNLDSLTNAELRELLLQYGIQNPVTNTTRNVLINKIRGKMQDKAKIRKTANYLTRYSSGEEESDYESRGIRSNAHNPEVMPPPPNKHKRPPMSQPTVKVPIQSRHSAYVPPLITSSDTDEDSDVINSRTTSRTSGPMGMTYGRLSGFNFPKRYSPQLDTTPIDGNLYSQSNRTSSLLFDNKPSPNAIRQRIPSMPNPPSTSSPYYKNNNSSLSDHTNNNSSSGAEDSHYVSDFTKRLLQFRDKTLSQDNNNHNTRRTTADNTAFNQRNNFRGSRLTRFDNEIVHQAPDNSARRAFTVRDASRNFFFKLDELYSVKQNLVPYVLLGALVFFLLLLIFKYLTISPDLVNTLQAKDTNFNLCDSILKIPASMMAGSNSNGLTACIHEEDVEQALDLLRLIAPELQRRIEMHKCTDSIYPFTVTAREALQMTLQKNQDMHEIEAKRNLHNMEYLIDINPQWHINHVDINGKSLSFDEVQQLRTTMTNAFGILNPRLPLSCLFYKKLQTFFFVVGSLGIVTTLGYFINTFYKFTVRVKRQRQQKVSSLISEVLTIVMNQAIKFQNNPEATLIVVNHLRDKLIEPGQRKEMESIWDEVIAFLEKNESRVQFEVGTRNGEDCKMIRWIDTVQTFPTPQPPMNVPVPQPAPATSNLYNSAQLSQMSECMVVKKWQSPAFDKANKIEAPPTQCLKIRQMFDKYETNNADLRTMISDAILEKAGPNCKVYDIQLEKQTCCVYVRCASEKDAGIVHSEINGWWFDNRLVSIKFLKLERFLARFPSSTNTTHLMRPSNSKKLSLSVTEPNNRFDDEDDDDEEEIQPDH